jgi:hypothetical protein
MRCRVISEIESYFIQADFFMKQANNSLVYGQSNKFEKPDEKMDKKIIGFFVMTLQDS